MNKRKLLGITISIILGSIIVGFHYYFKIFGAYVVQPGAIYIKSNDNFDVVVEKISPYVTDIDNFIWVANKKSFAVIKGGHYLLKKGMSASDVVNLLRSGAQTPVTISFNNQDSLEKLAGRIGEQIEADSIALLRSFTDSTFLIRHNLNLKTALEIYLPNSYEFYWNTSAEKFRDRMLQQYENYWTEQRVEKAKKLNLTKSEVLTLASIVQKETAQTSERPIVAGLYLNRLQSGIPLQADPTIIYAIREEKGQDFEVKRVLLKDLEIQSSYNTYLHRGLPPSVIAMPDISSIEAVLNPTKHNYIYMCVDVNNLGFHAFASSLRQHNRNAEKYHKWLSKQGINR